MNKESRFAFFLVIVYRALGPAVKLLPKRWGNSLEEWVVDVDCLHCNADKWYASDWVVYPVGAAMFLTMAVTIVVSAVHFSVGWGPILSWLNHL